MIEKLKTLVGATDEFLDPYVNQKTKLRVMCRNGHTRTIIPSNLVSRGQGSSCKECQGIMANNKYTTEAVNTLVKPYRLDGEYLGSLIKHNYYCTNNHVIVGKTLQQMRENYRCKECYPQRSDVRTQDEFAQIVKEKGLTLLSEYKGAKQPVEVKCLVGHTYSILPSNFTSHSTGTICRQCNPYASNIQMEIFSFISKFVKAEMNDRSKLQGLEIDIFIPEINIGIEVNGDYWHSDRFKDKNYHINKLNLAESAGISLMFIREYDWENRQDIIKQMLLSRIGKVFQVGGRHCHVRKLDYFPRVFLDANHLQGAGAPSQNNYGLFFREELVQVMTFSKPRFTKAYEYELVRFCNLTGVQVIGGASKLLKQFIQDVGTRSIITYAKRDYQHGNLYNKLGFSFSGYTVPGYTYYKNRKVYTRYQCQKHLLEKLVPEHYNPELSESEIMRNAGFNKVYDAGNLVYTLI